MRTHHLPLPSLGALVLLASSLAACSGGSGSRDAATAFPFGADAATPSPDADGGALPTDAGVADAAVAPDAEAPAGHFAVVTATTAPNPVDGGVTAASVTTYRMPFTSMRSGTRVQIALWGGYGTMELKTAWFGRYVGTQAGTGVVADNTPLRFGGRESATIPPSTILVSDPVDFEIESGERYAVSFAASGTIPYGQEIALDGVIVPGDRAAAESITGTIDTGWALHGLKWAAVHGPPQRVIAVLGDSIGAGMAAGGAQNTRFVDIAQLELGYPVVDASEGGDGVLRALERIPRDVLGLPGVTDCLVQVGTNDVHREDARFLIDNLSEIYRVLRANGIRPWAGTIMPRAADRITPEGEDARNQANDFMKSTDLVDGVVDFAREVADPAVPSRPAAGMLHEDGVHPVNAGHRAMADAMIKVFGPQPWPPPPAPPRGP